MLDAGIIEPVEESQWISHMVVQDKKTGEICIYIDFRKLKNACLHDPFWPRLQIKYWRVSKGNKCIHFVKFSIFS